MNENIKAGADIHAGDGGYSEGTKEKYDEFVKVRNRSLAEARIQQLADEAGLNYHNWMTNESNINDGDFKYPRLEDYKKFAELIVRECTKVVENLSPGYDDYRNQIEDAFRRDCVEQMKQQFGVEE
jgi:hypothetical protein